MRFASCCFDKIRKTWSPLHYNHSLLLKTYQISSIIFLTVFGTYQSQFRKENRGAANELFCYLFMKFMETSFLIPTTCGYTKISALEAAKRVGVLKKLENKGNAKFKSRKLHERFNIRKEIFSWQNFQYRVGKSFPQ